MAAQFAERILLGFLAIYPTQTVGTPRAHFICSVLPWRHGRPGHHSPQAWLHRSLLRVGWDSRVPEPRSQRNFRAPRPKGFEEHTKNSRRLLRQPAKCWSFQHQHVKDGTPLGVDTTTCETPAVAHHSFTVHSPCLGHQGRGGQTHYSRAATAPGGGLRLPAFTGAHAA